MSQRTGHDASGSEGFLPAAECDAAVASASDLLSPAPEIARLQNELAQVSAQLARTRADFDEFVSSISHDLRSPLLSLTGCVELLAEQYRGRMGADADELIGFITASVQRINDMIKGLLDYGHVGSHPLQLTACDLGAVLERVQQRLADRIRETGARIIHEPLPTVRADPERMEQLLTHLVENALKFRGIQSPRVHVSAMRDGDAWVMSVRDNGSGMDPDQASRVFGVFQRLHGDNPGCDGVGMGLAVGQKIVERHGGRIWVESQPGEGSIFRFTLPAP